MPHYIADYLAGGDPVVRRVAGVASLLPNVAWAGAQMMGLSYLLQILLGIDYRLAIAITSIVMIYYTVNGGLGAAMLFQIY
jgi:Na+(H+)/acetate symporter ActP